MLAINKENVKVLNAAQAWHEYVKTTTTKMLRMTGPFACETKEGRVECKDGYLALDAEGFPYPIAKSIHDKTYQRIPTKPSSR